MSVRLKTSEVTDEADSILKKDRAISIFEGMVPLIHSFDTSSVIKTKA